LPNDSFAAYAVAVADPDARVLNTGYRGRTGIYELIVMDEEIRGAVSRHASTGDLRTCSTPRR
jgi:type II secretory ATPase GspE/PulE/Tfp pilus assembly ATPase PilB-like protein